MTQTQHFLGAGILFGRAKAAYDRTRTRHAPTDQDMTSPDALDAILFAAATVEAFVNQVPTFLSTEAMADARLAEFTRALAKAEEQHAPTRKKLLLTSRLLHDKELDETEQPLRDTLCLIELRNELIHLKSEQIVHDKSAAQTLPDFVRELQQRKLAATPTHPASWTTVVQTCGVARWSCETARAMIGELAERITNHDARGKIMWFVKTFPPLA